MRFSPRVDIDGELSDGITDVGRQSDETNELERGPQSTARFARRYWQSCLPQRLIVARQQIELFA